MKLWLLRPRPDIPFGKDPWHPWFDKNFGFVARAETEQEARQMAHEDGEAENRGFCWGQEGVITTTPWLDAAYSTCIELTPDGEPGIIIADFAHA